MSNVHIGRNFETEFDYRAGVAGVLSIPQYVESKYVAAGKLVTTGGAWPDRVCAVNSLMFILDLKSTQNKNSVNICSGFDANTKRKKYNQFLKLQLAWENGVFAFYLVEWRENDDIVMYPVDGKSNWEFECKYDEGIHLGTGMGWMDDLCFEVLKAYGGAR